MDGVASGCSSSCVPESWCEQSVHVAAGVAAAAGSGGRLMAAAERR